MMTNIGIERKRDSHLWHRDATDFYVEEQWCSTRLFEEEKFNNVIWDPACGLGRIVDGARAKGLSAFGSDIMPHRTEMQYINFLLQSDTTSKNLDIVCNPPFELFEQFALKALQIAKHKVAMIWLVRRLNAARWLEQTPLLRIWLMTPRPSMPPGRVILAGEKPGGGTQDFCWLVWDKHYDGRPELRWLRRDT